MSIVVSDPAQIARMDIREAYENYKRAMDVVKQALRTGRPHTARHWRGIADKSLDAHFAKTDAWLTKQNQRGAWSVI